MSEHDADGRNSHGRTNSTLLDLAYPYALDAVSESERHDIVGQLSTTDAATAQAFRRIVADAQETMAIVGYSDSLVPPSRLKTSILAAIDELESTDDLRRRRLRRLQSRTSRYVLAAAAAVIVALGIVVATGQFTGHGPAGSPSVSEVMASPDVHVVSADVAGGTITVAASAKSNAVVVSMDNVPPPPAGHVYQMWFMHPQEQPRSAGTMGATTMPPPGGEVIPQLRTASSVAVTVEPGAGSPQPTGQPVITIGLT